MMNYLEDYRNDSFEPQVFEDHTFYAITDYLHPDVELRTFDKDTNKHGY